MAGVVCVVGGISVVRRGESLRRTDRVREVLLLLVAVPCCMTFWCGAPCWTGPAQGTASWNAYHLPLSLPPAPSSAAVAASFSTIALVTQPHIPCEHLVQVAVVLDPLLGVGGVPLWRGATGWRRRSQMQQVIKIL